MVSVDRATQIVLKYETEKTYIKLKYEIKI